MERGSGAWNCCQVKASPVPRDSAPQVSVATLLRSVAASHARPQAEHMAWEHGAIPRAQFPATSALPNVYKKRKLNPLCWCAPSPCQVTPWDTFMPVCACGEGRSPTLSLPRVELLVSKQPSASSFSPSSLVDSVSAQGGPCCQPPGLLRPVTRLYSSSMPGSPLLSHISVPSSN